MEMQSSEEGEGTVCLANQQANMANKQAAVLISNLKLLLLAAGGICNGNAAKSETGPAVLKRPITTAIARCHSTRGTCQAGDTDGHLARLPGQFKCQLPGYLTSKRSQQFKVQRINYTH